MVIAATKIMICRKTKPVFCYFKQIANVPERKKVIYCEDSVTSLKQDLLDMYFQSPTMHVQTQICCIQDQYYAFDKTTELDYSFFQLENI